ncbi:hypothetical protein LG71_19465 [Pluralibacter gergoviae]|uniref:hypothetical protein n=1 Tax=Pluralibacter gergoviae TaxID=61647 RepID=UPI0004F59CD2|nr:hypothetical protein [Pluralibacter gergoviae]AIR01940.1 hypothetical protein LG71_19465 [Pluralibacter gergoviae]
MSYGAVIRNGNNQIVIDQDYMNLSIVQSGVINTGRDINNPDKEGNQQRVVYGSSPIICIAPDNNSCIAAVQKIQNDGAFTYNFFGYGSCRYAIFDIGYGSSEKYGLRVFNSVGGVVFDSGRKYMRVVDFISIDRLDQGYAVPNGTYGFINCGPSMEILADYDDNTGLAALVTSDYVPERRGDNTWRTGNMQTGWSDYKYPDFGRIDVRNPLLVVNLTGYV